MLPNSAITIKIREFKQFKLSVLILPLFHFFSSLIKFLFRELISKSSFFQNLLGLTGQTFQLFFVYFMVLTIRFKTRIAYEYQLWFLYIFRNEEWSLVSFKMNGASLELKTNFAFRAFQDLLDLMDFVFEIKFALQGQDSLSQVLYRFKSLVCYSLRFGKPIRISA